MRVLEGNDSVYLGFSAISALLFLFARLTTPKRKDLILPLAYTFVAVLYAASYLLTFRHVEYPAVTSIAVMLSIPFLFIDRPIRVMGLNLLFVAVFCVLTALKKATDVAAIDIWNALSFELVALIAVVFQMRFRYRSLVQKRKKRLFDHKREYYEASGVDRRKR